MKRISQKLNLPDNFQPNLSAFEHCAFLNSNNFGSNKLIALGLKNSCVVNTSGTAIAEFQNFLNNTSDWVFGVLSYDLKNEIEKLESKQFNPLNLPDLCFFQPEIVLEKNGDEWFAHFFELDKTVFESYLKRILLPVEPLQATLKNQVLVETKNQYLESINTIKNHLQRGDIYQVNYCTGILADLKINQTFALYQKLNAISQAPFSGYFRYKNAVLACGSPERYLKKEGQTLISQPIKGTAKLGSNQQENELIAAKLKSDLKERAENIMIVDLVRNDLSKVAEKQSVEVTELCEPYQFKTVHQLISTITCKVKSTADFQAILNASFPMGSMTGAPKLNAMIIAEKLEKIKRSWFSGSLGYFKPNGDFDFNVIIRSLLYNAELQKLSIQVGGGITIKSEPEKEYQECLLKAESMLKVLSELNAVQVS